MIPYGLNNKFGINNQKNEDASTIKIDKFAFLYSTNDGKQEYKQLFIIITASHLIYSLVEKILNYKRLEKQRCHILIFYNLVQ